LAVEKPKKGRENGGRGKGIFPRNIVFRGCQTKEKETCSSAKESSKHRTAKRDITEKKENKKYFPRSLRVRGEGT